MIRPINNCHWWVYRSPFIKDYFMVLHDELFYIELYETHFGRVVESQPSMMAPSNGYIFCVTGPLCGEFPTERPVTRSFDVFFDLRQNKLLSKQSWGWWFETPSSSRWRHCNVSSNIVLIVSWELYICWHLYTCVVTSLRSSDAYVHRWSMPTLV